MKMETEAKKRIKIGKYQFVLWIAPMFIMMAVFCYYPVGHAVYASFTDWNGTTSHFIGLQNYAEMFRDVIFWRGMRNVLILIVSGLVIGNVAPIALAMLLFNLRYRRVMAAFRFFFILPMLVPGIVSMMIWTKMIFNPAWNGLANSVLQVFGLKKPLGFYFVANQALWSLILTGFPWVAGTSFLIYLAGFNNIPVSVLEASRLDGAGAARRFFKIELPYLVGQIKYFVILGIIGGMQGFGMQLMVTKGGPMYATMVPGYSIYLEAFGGMSRYGYACCLGMLIFVITLIITVINNRFIKTTEDLTNG